MKHFYSLLPATLFAGFAGILSTSSLATDATSSEYVADDVIEITSTRLPQTVGQSITPVTVIDRESIQENGYSTLVDVLQTEANIQITTPGGKNQLARIITRGTDTRHTLILIDGIPVNQLTSGSISLEAIPLSTINRIEIIKGASSSIYGSAAIGGVINIITADNPQSPISLGTEISSETSINSWVTLSDKLGKGNLVTTFGREVRDGIDAVPTFEKDEDGLNKTYGRLHFAQALNNQYSVSLGGSFSKGDVEYDGYYNSRTFFNYQANISLTNTSDSSTSKFTLLTQEEKPEDFVSSATGSDIYLSKRDSAQWIAKHNVSNYFSILTGLDFEQQSIEGTTLSSGSEFGATERDNTGITLALSKQLANTSFEAGTRYDNSSQYGSTHTENLGVSHFIGDDVEFFAKYATAFKAPTFNQLYYPGYSNPNLKPEESEQVEFGFTVAQEDTELSLAFYKNRMTNRIAYDSSIFQPNNISRSTIRGIEFSASHNSKRWSNQVLVNLINAKNTETNQDLPFIASQKLALKSKYSISPALNGFINIEAQNNYKSNGGDIPGFAVADIGLNYKVDEKFNTSFTIVNITDHEYFQDYYTQFNADYTKTLHKYNEPGRQIIASFHYNY